MRPELEPDPFPPDPPQITWLAAACCPLHEWAHWSKNRIWRVYRGQKRLTAGAAARRAEMAALLRAALARPVVQNRVWVAIHVAKADNRGDAPNVVDLVLDAVQRAVGLDDRWFALHGVTWSIEPDSPSVAAWVGQEPGAVDVCVCGACGHLLLPEAFHRNQSSATGRASTCKLCLAERRKRPPRARRAHGPPANLSAKDPPPWGVAR